MIPRTFPRSLKENGRNRGFRPSLNREASRLGDVRVRRPSFRALVPEIVPAAVAAETQ